MFLSTATLLLQIGVVGSAVSEPPPDPRVLRGARGAQIRFESVRRMLLPRDRSYDGGSRTCDARIGRFCYWYDSTEDKVVPEPPRIGDARAKLLAVLDSAAAVDPKEPWVAGQRVRYFIEAGRFEDAAVAARACRAERWWCASLEGLALHVAQNYAAADSIFAVALRDMSDAQRCDWSDIRFLVSNALARQLARTNCGERERLTSRLWALAQPLWSAVDRGNDARTEHLARLTMATILEHSANGFGTSWGSDIRQLMIRYGWDEWFTRHDPEFGSSYGPRITGHSREPSYAFFPDIPNATAPVQSSAWRFTETLARSRYSPRHLKRISSLAHQLTRFPRGDSTFVRFAYTTRDTGMRRDRLIAAVATYARDSIHVWRLETPTSGVMLPGESVVISLEVVDPQTHRAERARYTMDRLPCHAKWCLSDLVLFDADGGYSGNDMDSVFAVALTDTRVQASSPLGVFWEIESPAPGPAWLALTAEPINVSAARRIATRLHLAREQVPVRLRWQTSLQSPRQTQSLAVRLPSGARGAYRVTLSVMPSNGPIVSSVREIEIVQ